MKLNTALPFLLVTPLILTACGESATEPLPEGTAPDEPERAAVEPVKPEVTYPGSIPEVDPDIPTSPTTPDAKDLSGNPLSEADRTSISGLSFVLPEGWKAVLPDSPNAMRRVTLVPPAEFVEAELAVFRFTGDVGGFPMNVNRWAGQVGLPPITGLMTAATSDFEQLTIDGKNATWIPLMNPDTNLAILAVWVPIGAEPENPDFTWTLKMTCKAEYVQALTPAIRAWCESIKFED